MEQLLRSVDSILQPIKDRLKIKSVLRKLEAANPDLERTQFTYRLPLNAALVTEVEIDPKEGTHRGPFLGAIDFDVPLGTEVLAAMDGKIVEIIEHNTESGSTEEFREKLNYITIQHVRTLKKGKYSILVSEYTQYCHLASNSYRDLRLEIGSKVKAGQPIAKTGSSGQMSEPCFHFFIFRIIGDQKYKGLKPRFRAP